MFSRRTVQNHIHETLQTYRQLTAKAVIEDLLDACMKKTDIVTENPSDDTVIVNDFDTHAIPVEIKSFSFS